MNAWKHGLTAETLVTENEDPARFNELRALLFEEFDPSSGFECELVDRVAGLMWRLRRVPGLEAALFAARGAIIESRKLGVKQVKNPFTKGLSEGDEAIIKLGKALIEDASQDVLGKLCRHELTLMSALTKTLQLLLMVQNRRGEAATVTLSSNDVAAQ